MQNAKCKHNTPRNQGGVAFPQFKRGAASRSAFAFRILHFEFGLLISAFEFAF
jgi:hypothetical protein